MKNKITSITSMINLSAFHLIAFGVFCTVIGLSTPGIVFSVCAIISGIVGLYAYIHEAEQDQAARWECKPRPMFRPFGPDPFGPNGLTTNERKQIAGAIGANSADINTLIGEPIGSPIVGEFETGTNAPKLDAKFYGMMFKVKNGQRVWDDEWCVFLAKDNAFAAVLPAYREKCKEMGASADQLAAVDRLIGRVEKWRAANPAKCKTPDVQAGEALLDVAYAPNTGAIKDGAA